MEYIFAVLHTNEALAKIPKTNPEARLQIITREMFQYVYLKVSQSLQLEHQALFTLRLAQIRLGSDYDQMFEVLLKSTAVEISIGSSNAADGLLIYEGVLGEGRLTKTQVKKLEELSINKSFKTLPQSLEQNQGAWLQFLDHPNAESCVPEIPNPELGSKDGDTIKEMKKLTVLKILRPDRFIAAVKMFVAKALGE
jgi:dynein heavy chain 1, cytosolic